MIKKSLLAVMMAALTAGQASAKTDIGALNKELQIMTGIMQTALKQSNDPKEIRFRSIDATYLINQGVVFEISTSNGGGFFNFNFNGIPMPIQAPEALTSGAGDSSVFIDIDGGEWQHEVEEAIAMANEAIRGRDGKLRDLREREREFSWESREYERRQRDLEFEKRTADDERRKYLDEELREIQKVRQKLESKRSEIAKYAAEIEEEHIREAKERDEVHQRKYKRFLAKFESSVGDILCRYGAGINAVPESENVSFVLSDFETGDGHSGKQDRIYVFKNKDIRACVKEKINAETLLSNVEAYIF